jgi:4-amino-4-deoxy-L-arabinose transferase-like glycosyltransferase
MLTLGQHQSSRYGRQFIVVLAVVGLIYCLAAMASPLSRTQEGRVLETARQMLGQGADGWLSPTLDGEPRLQKPPLCYWYTAGFYKFLGVSEFTGRLPVVVLSLGLIGLVFGFARDLLGSRGGFIAATVASSMMLLIRFASHAETDVPAAFGVMLACWMLVRAHRPDAGPIVSMHLAAVGIAIAALTKGGPVVFPLLWLVALCFLSRSIRPLTRFVFSGAIVTCLALVLPWYLYIRTDPAFTQLRNEIGVVAVGSNQFGHFWKYIPQLLAGLLPWTALTLVACWCAARKCRTDPIARSIVTLSAVVAVPLILIGNKQPHYLIPLLPMLAILTAWLLERSLRADTPADELRLCRIAFVATLIAMLVVAAAPIGVGAWMTSSVRPIDGVASLLLLLVPTLLLFFFRRLSAEQQVVRFCVLLAVSMPVLSGLWARSLEPDSLRDVVEQARDRFGDVPFVLYDSRPNPNLSFVFRQSLKPITDQAQLVATIRGNPSTVVIHVIEPQRNERHLPMPTLLHHELTLTHAGWQIDFLRLPAN